MAASAVAAARGLYWRWRGPGLRLFCFDLEVGKVNDDPFLLAVIVEVAEHGDSDRKYNDYKILGSMRCSWRDQARSCARQVSYPERRDSSVA